MTRIFKIYLPNLMTVLLIATAVQAHRAKSAFTILEWSSDASTLQVTHQLHLHDASVALSFIENNRNAEVLNLEGQAKLMLHITPHFNLWDGTGNAIALEPLGAEVSGPHLYLYYESAVLAEQPTKLSVRHAVLMDVFADQTNQINLQVGSTLKTLRFGDKDAIETAELN